MADDASNALAPNPAAQPAPAAPADAGTAPAAAAPVSGETQPDATTNQPQPEKTFTQAELDRIVAQRLARQQRQHDRELQLRQPPPQPAAQPEPQPNARPDPKDYGGTTEAYVEALTAWKAEQVVQQTIERNETQARESRNQDFMANVERTFREREDKAALVYADYQSVVYENPGVIISNPMALAIKQADNGADIAYHLGKNPQDSQRIARLHPLAQAMEIGRIGAKIAANPAPASSSAPAPIPAVRPNGSVPAFDTTDPRSTQSMSASDWIKADRERQRRKLEGANR